MIYYELVEHDIRFRNNVVEAGMIEEKRRDYVAYESIFGYGKDILDHLKIPNAEGKSSVTGYNGTFYAKQILIDFDNKENPDAARDSAIEVLNRIVKLGCPAKFVRFYFSGQKGFHLVLHPELFITGGFPGSADLPRHIKNWVTVLTEGVSNIDYGIYAGNKIVRLPHSKHNATGLYKIPLSADELINLPIEDIKKLAIEPRLDFKFESNISELYAIQGFKDLTQKKPETKVEALEKSDGTLFSPAYQGERNNKYFKQAIRLMACGLGFNEALQIITNANIASGNPISDAELKQAVKSAKKYAEAKIVNEENPDLQERLFADIVPEWIEYIKNTDRKMSLMFDDIDEDFRYKYEGKLITVIGKGGSRKSLYAQNLLLYNAQRFGCRGIYSSMEMGDIPLMNRTIDMLVVTEENNSSFDLLIYEQSQPGFASNILLNQVLPVISDKFLFFDHAAMTAERYDKLIEGATNRRGRIDFLVVDGLSMMGGKGSETEVYSQNTKELKELAKKWKICIILLCHTTKEPERSTRNLAPFVRGSEKILDNADAIVSMSLLVDPAYSENEEPAFIRDKGYFHLWNKRGSGNTFKRIYELNTRTLTIRQSHDSPDLYEIKKKKKGRTLEDKLGL